MKKNKLPKLLGVLLISTLFLAAFTDVFYFKINKSFEIFGDVFKEIAMNYVDEIDPEKLINDGIAGMLQNLDPYTVYIDEDNSDDLDIITTGSFTGLGITVTVRDNQLTIVEMQDGFSAQRHGIRIGDRLYKIDSTVILNGSTEELRKYTRGTPGTMINLWVLRDGIDDTIHFTLPREEIRLKNVTYSGMISDSIGYIKLDRFSRLSAEEVRSALKELRKNQNIRGLVLDLRDNPGGLLQSAVSICELFVPEKSLIVSTKGRDDRDSRSFYSEMKPIEPELPIAILINNYSASASEIVAGAIQDLDRGIIIGERSFGKGLVQSVFDLPYRASLKMTTSRYYTPSGRCIQKVNYFGKKQANGNGNVEEAKFYTKNGRTVDESIGIIPDSLLKVDDYSDFVNNLLNENIIFNFATEYSSKLKELPKDFKITKDILTQFDKYLIDKNFKLRTPLNLKISELEFIAKDESSSQEIIKQIEKLKTDIKNEEKNLVQKFSKEISGLLEDEIHRRFYSQKFIISQKLYKDNFIETAVSLLKRNEYNRILANTPIEGAAKNN